MGEEDDDWGLSAEQLDFLEEDAIRKISQRKSASASASASVPDNSDRYRNNWTNDLPKLSVSLFLHHSGMVAAKFPYSPMLVDAFHKIPKATWNGRERVWIFPPSSLEKAEEVLSAVPGAAVEVHKLDPLVRRALVAASAVPDLQDLYDRMPSYIESRLLPFQREGVRFVLQHGGRAIAVAACFPDAWPVLVITPSSLRLHWASVVLSQSGGSNKAGFKVVYSNSKSKIHLDGVFNIISYDVIPKIQDILLNSEFKIVVADESHFLKNPQAKRTNASLPVLQKARYVILLSGTPALSRPIELFKQLEALYPDVYKNVHEYGNRYCRGGVFGCYQGASNHEELHNLMRATVMIRRLKKDVISQLPVKRRQQVFLDLNEKDMKQIRALFRELEAVKSSIQSCDSKEKISSLKIVEKNLINKIYTDSAEAKIPAVLDYLATVIEKKKVDCIRIDGSTPTTSRQTLVTDFQEKDAIKAAVLSIKAGGVGLTLTAASTVIFAELSWTPGDIIQAEDRVHRIGQESAVNIYYLLANDTIDDIIWDAVLSKLENLGQVLDGQEKTLEVDVSGAGKSPIAKKGMVETSRSPVGKKGMAGTSTSPGKQTTLDSFLKRCHSPTDSQLRAKTPRF
ncbi:putative SMARCAL1-like protein [Ananas comosus]|uniref:Putative SMARCAL1-like protein n=1 Tax=Ananas comosus TaxID=4615 RepID=A0A199V937_ANACO|nr:putative SMARCAL1-like protein [Ananas comosus]